MADEQKNTWGARIKRTLTSVLPVSPQRRGGCVQCGACCRLPNVCPFLKTNGDGHVYCRIYRIRPLNCRKYPRTPSEHITADTCGFRFEDGGDQCEA
jgi:hypothetical protein